uniref:Methionine aminopeptidase n=1 Tax=uncultured delta proteobacterium Rifle_16ft_4_minimus_12842 TaxID=1665174 RepID=A0A0H4TKE7_9DELT|nr:map, methionine aminopeptidase, methionyl aminopeptidase [uncultured delta proteobacterium Rifle_16ft_4_minimus_12842]
MSREAIIIKSPDEIETMRRAGAVVAEVLEVLKGNVRPGATTLDLEKIAEEETIKRKASPAFKGYRGYPFCLCTSVNNEVVHGMPSKKVLKEGDIVSIDYGALVEGFYGDAAVTVPVGKVSEEAARLVRVTEESLGKAIEAAREGNRLLDISSAVQSHVEPQGFSVVREFVGHGIGRELHEPPQVPNFGIPGRGVKLKTGMVLAIEPMINSGGWAVKILADGWTAVTADGKLSAHFEHTVAITPDGPRVLTMI